MKEWMTWSICNLVPRVIVNPEMTYLVYLQCTLLTKYMYPGNLNIYPLKHLSKVRIHLCIATKESLKLAVAYSLQVISIPRF